MRVTDFEWIIGFWRQLGNQLWHADVHSSLEFLERLATLFALGHVGIKLALFLFSQIP